MKLKRFDRVLRQVSLLPVLVLGVTAGSLYFQVLHANRTVALIQRSDQRISQATLAAKLIVDEETGLRGYQATGDRRFLEPYEVAQGRLGEVFRALDNAPGSLSPDGIPVHGIEDLKQSHRLWTAEFAQPMIATLNAGGTARELDLNLRGKQLMDLMRGELDATVRRSEQRRAARIALWQRQVRLTEFALFALAIAAGIVIGLFTRNRMHWVSDVYRASLDDLNRRAEEIFDSEQRLRTTLTSIGDGVIACDAGECVQMMNRVAEEMTGWTQTEAFGAPLREVFPIINEVTRRPVEDPVTQVRRLRRTVDLANHTVLVRRDGTEVHIAHSGAPILDKDGGLSGVVLVFRDVTMERRTQEALVAQEKLATAGRLAATIAHEINNPLSSVLDMLYLLRSGTGEEDAKQYLQMAEAELQRVGSIVRAMLGLYRESQAPILVDLGATLEELLLLLDRRIAELEVRVVADLPADVCVMGFPAELRQVFTNLITNAAEAAGPGGEVRVSARWEKDPSGRRPVRSAAVVIEDNGPGIPVEVLPQLFQPFFTTKGERGTGLGLWVSQGIVVKHNGRIDLKSSTDAETHGTTAKVFLPSSGLLAKSANA